MATSASLPGGPDDAPVPGEPRGDGSCPNCGSRLVRRYCADCGQAAPDPADYSLRAHATDFVDQIASLDGRVARTAWTLVARPGALTADHLSGRRARYLRPLQLFLLVNVLLFVVAPKVPMFSYSLGNYLVHHPPSPTLVARLVERATPTDGKAREDFTAAFDARVEAQRKGLIILFVPAVALVLRALLARHAAVAGAPRRYGEHLVFSLHVLAFVWLALAGAYAVATLAGRALGAVGRIAVLAAFLALLLTMPVYVFRAVRRVYGLSRPWSLAVTAVLAATFMGLLLAYRALLFFTTYYTL
jgi:hypothetical protein